MFSRILPPAPIQVFDGIDAVEAAVPEILVVPGILADGKRTRGAGQTQQRLAVSRGEVAHLVENVIGGQEALGLDGGNLAVAQHGGRVQDMLAGAGMSGGDNTANHRDASGLAGDFFSRFAISFDEPRTINQVARRITTDAQFREENEVDSCALGSQRVVDDFG